ncbi:hypothetical protein EVA_13610 [gut metagenome]|uniref:Uncharacterized protein n=1 Tax=gut metagenome TaxID=749906 RepID=J9FTK0_9ZZZZ
MDDPASPPSRPLRQHHSPTEGRRGLEISNMVTVATKASA